MTFSRIEKKTENSQYICELSSFGLLVTQSFLSFAYEYNNDIPMQMKIIPNIIVSPPTIEGNKIA